MSNIPAPSPTVHVSHWSEAQVADWLGTIGLAKFAKDFRSNGITGDVLILLDDDALHDIGVSTIGHRLALLAAIYRLKQQFAIPIQEGDWIPKSIEAHDAFPATATSPHLVSLLRQRDDRIRTLESQIFRLADYLSRFQQDFVSVCKHVGVKTLTSEMSISVTSGSSRHEEEGGHSHTSSDSSAISLSAFASQSDLATSASSNHVVDSPTARNFSGIVSPSRSGFASPLAHSSGHRSGGAPSGYGQSAYGQQHADESQAPSSAGYQAGGSSMGPSSGFKPASQAAAASYGRNDGYSWASGFNGAGPNTPATAASSMQASTSMPSLSSANSINTASPTHSTPSATPTTAISAHVYGSSAASVQSPTRRQAQASPSNNNSHHGLTRSTSNNALAQARNISPVQAGSSVPAAGNTSVDVSSKSDRSITPTSASLTSKAAGPGTASGGHISSDINPYKSFRVTLDDPCHKVLPAALKKYKIVDDWRLYALFICYGSTERCLSYDEKPLQLFQKLKENKQSPVFMLRHIRDVKSPIAIANAKAESKKDQVSSASSSATAAKSSSAGGRSDKRRLINGAPPLGANISHLSSPVETGPAAELPTATKATRTYAVAIYPYLSERNDEFDVGVGDVFMVRNKAKGWWVVQRDSKGTGTGDIVYSVPSSEADDSNPNASYQAEISSGWVPAGCLLETSKPLAQIVEPGSLVNSGPNTPTVATAAASSSSSSAATTLGAATARASIPPTFITSTSTLGIMLMDYSADDGLEFKKEDRLRVFKRYNHWSYCVQEGEAHARGWVPSWYIGKISTSNGADSGAVGGGVGRSGGGGVNGGASGSAGNTPKDAKAPALPANSGTTISPTTLVTSTSPGAVGMPSNGEVKSPVQELGNGGDGLSPPRGTVAGEGGAAASALAKSEGPAGE